MNIFGAIILGAIITFTVLGLIIGLCKGFATFFAVGIQSFRIILVGICFVL